MLYVPAGTVVIGEKKLKKYSEARVRTLDSILAPHELARSVNGAYHIHTYVKPVGLTYTEPQMEKEEPVSRFAIGIGLPQNWWNNPLMYRTLIKDLHMRAEMLYLEALKLLESGAENIILDWSYTTLLDEQKNAYDFAVAPTLTPFRTVGVPRLPSSFIQSTAAK